MTSRLPLTATIPHSRPTVGPDEAEAVAAVVRSGQLAQGARVSAFEEAVARGGGARGGGGGSSGAAGPHPPPRHPARSSSCTPSGGRCPPPFFLSWARR